MGKHALWFGLLLVLLPFFAAQLTGHTFAPLDVLYSTTVPYVNGTGAVPYPQSHFWSDTVNFYWPRLATLSRHEFPISYTSGGGIPLYADTISGYFSPFAWASFGWLGSGPRVLDFFWMLQFGVLFAGMFLFLKQQGLPKIAALTSSLLYTFCTHYFVGSYFSFQSLGAMAFLPWSLWAGEKWKSGAHRFWMPQLFLALCVYSGNVQTALFPALVFSCWFLLKKEYGFWLYSGVTAVLLSLPLWLTGYEYHILQNAQGLDRGSHVPIGTWAKLKALGALPALFYPEILGSPKHVDFLKGFKTSATYFFGSIGLLAPLAVWSARKNIRWKERLPLFCLTLLALSLFVLVTPVLNILYYRIFCVTLLALAILAGIALEKFNIQSLRRSSLSALAGLALFAAVVWYVKRGWEHHISAFLIDELSKSVSNQWIPNYFMERLSRWFAGYMSDWRLWLTLVLLAALAIAAKRLKPTALAGILLLDIFGLWCATVLWQPLKPHVSPDLEKIHALMKQDPNYPLVRFAGVPCEPGPILFGYPQNEFIGLPKLGLYGSTRVAALVETETRCDHPSKTFQHPLGLEASYVATQPGWSPWQQKGVTPPWAVLQYKAPGYWLWRLNWAHGYLKFKKVDSWGVDAEISTLGTPLEEWTFEVPYYPGWRYWLDGREIRPAKIYHSSLPVFTERIDVMENHEFIARFTPRMLIYGGWGALAGALLAAGAAIFASRRTRPNALS